MLRLLALTLVVTFVLFTVAAYAEELLMIMDVFSDGSCRSYTVYVDAQPPCRSAIRYSDPAPSLARSEPLPEIPRCPVGGGPYEWDQ